MRKVQAPCLYPIKKTTFKVVLQFRLNTRQQLTLRPVKAYAGEGIYSLTLALKGRLLFVPALPALKLRPNPRVQVPLPISNKKRPLLKWSYNSALTRRQLTLRPVKAYAGEGIYSLTLALKGRLLFVPALPALKLRPNPRVQAPLPISNKKRPLLKWSFFIGAGEGI